MTPTPLSELCDLLVGAYPDRQTALSIAQRAGIAKGTWPISAPNMREWWWQTLQVMRGQRKILALADAAIADPAVAAFRADLERLRARLAAPEERPDCPYPGMVPFTAADARFFHGREAEIEQMLRHLRNQRLLFVIGASGSGKSSLINAGLLPKLDPTSDRRSKLFAKGYWLARTMRPGADPMGALHDVLGGVPADPGAAVAALLAANPPAQRLLLGVDQFEEVFTPQVTPEARRQFIAAIQALRDVEACTLLIAMRADFYPDLMNSDLWEAAKERRMEVVALRGEALKAAIVEPAEQRDVEVEAALVERLLRDAAGEPGALPMLQETLVLLWAAIADRRLALDAYETLGEDGRSGLAVAIATKADAVYAGLTPAGQATTRRIFLRLIQFGEGREDTRRQQPEGTLLAAGDDPAAFTATLDELAQNRLLTLSGEEEGGERRVDISHEALIAGWPRLQAWGKERRAAEQTRRRLEDKAAEWARLGRGAGGLLDETELPEAERWLTSDDATELGYSDDLRKLAETSRAELDRIVREQEAARERELQLNRAARRRLQYLVAALGVLLVGVLAIVGNTVGKPAVLRHLASREGQPVTIPEPRIAIAMEEYEVTTLRYRQCVKAGVCKEPGPNSTYGWTDSDQLPVTDVSADQAAKFCEWISRRLPTVEEWEYVATKGGTADWPWGLDPPSEQYANLCYDDCDAMKLRIADVASYPDGAYLGIYNVVGNVAEWAISRSGLATVGGSSLSEPAGQLVNPVSNIRGSEYVGIRCVEALTTE